MTEVTKTFYVNCKQKGCKQYDREINSIDLKANEESAFRKAYGHGGESTEDTCEDCGELGELQ